MVWVGEANDSVEDTGVLLVVGEVLSDIVVVLMSVLILVVAGSVDVDSIGSPEVGMVAGTEI